MLTALALAAALAQAPAAATLRVTVVDPSGAVIVGAHVAIVRADAPAAATSAGDTNGRGEAEFTALSPGRYAVRAESPGFERAEIRDVRVRAGDNRREVKLAIEKMSETVQVGRDPRERASDPRGDAFATVLGQAEINELPDDPDDMENVLRDMAGPGATMRVNGFRGGKLPPKNQIQQIRFRRNMFAADAHEAGFVSIDIITKPGFDNWRGGANVGFRDAALSARNAFAPVKGDEQHDRYGFSFSGPLKEQRTSLAFSVEGDDGYDSKTIVAALPAGTVADSIRRPSDTVNLSARLEHGVTPTQVLRAEVQRNHTSASNLGVGDFDLAERAYGQTTAENVFRLAMSGSLRKALFNDFKVQFRESETSSDPVSMAPAVLVLNAFDAGGAQLAGARRSRLGEISNDLEIAARSHAIRAGFLVEGGEYSTDEARNTGGTFTFGSLAAYEAGAPTTFTRDIGNPHVATSEWQAGLYVQDDYRARKDLTVSGGVRGEYQSMIGGLHLGPRGGVTWSPFKSGKTTVRAGGGVFFDWFDAQIYEQAVQLDGTHQQIETTRAPGYPDPTRGGRALLLPPGRVELAPHLDQPEFREAMFGVERALPGGARLNTMYVHRAGRHVLRGVNVNAPLASGLVPDPAAGPITQIASSASSQFDGLFINLNYMNPQKKLFVGASYALSRSIDEADGALSLPANSYDLAAERGPALTDARHRFMTLVNVPLVSRLRLGTSVRVQSGLPYNVTTGFDDNGDTVSNDRPAGVTRNTGRGAAQVDVGARLSWATGFGAAPQPGGGGPQVRIVRSGDSDPLSSLGGVDGVNKRYTVELYAQAYNLLNHLNPLNYAGVVTSPFFGQATSAAPPRRLEIGARLTF